MKIFIPNINQNQINRKQLFILTRPFYTQNGWTNEFKKDWNIDDNISFTDEVKNANLFLIPMNINWYFDTKNRSILEAYNQICKANNIKAYGVIGGDFAIKFPDYSHIEYFRMGGFKSKLSDKNYGFPVSLSDHFKGFYGKENIEPTAKKDLPTIGFCGHCDLSFAKKIKELAKCSKENFKRFLKNPWNTNYEPLFASAFERAKLLQYFKKSNVVKTNFIYRKNYRGGAVTPIDLEKTTLEYYDNIKNSDFVLCVRGAGNFSVRFYETLMMGKIPVFVDTDCLLPFENHINWKKHVVWIEWENRKNIVKIVTDFYNEISAEDFITLQLENRKLWKESLSVNNMLLLISGTKK
jgi:hypothetical protein